MRKVSETVVKAFLAGKEKRVGNTYTNGNALFLHGNMIGWKRDRGLGETVIEVSTAGWNTGTTRERLNCLFSFLSSFGYESHVKRAFQRNFETYFEVITPTGEILLVNASESNVIAGTTGREAAKVG